MKTIILILMSLLLSSQAFATVGPALIEKIPQADFDQLDARIERAVEKKIGFKNIRKFKVDWNSQNNACIETSSEFDPSVSMGVCIVEFGGFQVTGHASVVVKDQGYSISAINADVE